MIFTLCITEEAQLEETDAYNYYENIREGLGEDFLMELESCYNKIVKNPFHYSFVQNSKILRDTIVGKFPYLVVYLVTGHIITILSVRNTYRRPFLF